MENFRTVSNKKLQNKIQLLKESHSGQKEVGPSIFPMLNG